MIIKIVLEYAAVLILFDDIAIPFGKVRFFLNVGFWGKGWRQANQREKIAGMENYTSSPSAIYLYVNHR
jgi:peptidyl-tRNA hydrolase